mmetsp:Transcript_114472/g.199112  ORF Transcript_114472/g.199112 Transcript_114472/m.199112 type:complete len:457 (+) Transcript_114472:1117-2487(+)
MAKCTGVISSPKRLLCRRGLTSPPTWSSTPGASTSWKASMLPGRGAAGLHPPKRGIRRGVLLRVVKAQLTVDLTKAKALAATVLAAALMMGIKSLKSRWPWGLAVAMVCWAHCLTSALLQMQPIHPGNISRSRLASMTPSVPLEQNSPKRNKARDRNPVRPTHSQVQLTFISFISSLATAYEGSASSRKSATDPTTWAKANGIVICIGDCSPGVQNDRNSVGTTTGNKRRNTPRGGTVTTGPLPSQLSGFCEGSTNKSIFSFTMFSTAAENSPSNVQNEIVRRPSTGRLEPRARKSNRRSSIPCRRCALAVWKAGTRTEVQQIEAKVAMRVPNGVPWSPVRTQKPVMKEPNAGGTSRASRRWAPPGLVFRPRMPSDRPSRSMLSAPLRDPEPLFGWLRLSIFVSFVTPSASSRLASRASNSAQRADRALRFVSSSRHFRSVPRRFSSSIFNRASRS